MDAELNLTLDNVTIVATGEQEAGGLNVVLEDVLCEAIAYKEVWANAALVLGKVTVVATGELGEAPDIPAFILAGIRIYNLTGEVREDGGAILCFIGPPDKSVEWRILEGFGSVTPFTTYTDEHGRCSARFNALGVPGRVVVGVAYVP